MHKSRRRRAAGPTRRSQCRDTDCECECAANSLTEQQLRSRGLRCDRKGADQDRVVAVASDSIYHHHHLKHAALATTTTSSSSLVALAPDANNRRRIPLAPRLVQDNDGTAPLPRTLRASSFHAISTARTTLQVVTSPSKSASPTSAIGAGAVRTTGGAEWTISDTSPRPAVSSSSTPSSNHPAAMETTGLAIAAICIATALVVVIVAFGVYVMRTRGLSFSDVFRRKARPRHRIDRTYDIAKPTVHRMPAYAGDDRKPPSYSQSVPLPRRPEPAATRTTENASKYTPAASQSGLLKPTPRPSTPPGFKSPSNTSFLDDASPPRNASRQSHHSRQPSSPTSLPLQRQHTHHASNVSDHTLAPLFRLAQDDAPRENSFYRSRESSVNLSRESSLTRPRSRDVDALNRSRANSVDAPRDRETSFLAAEAEEDDDDDDDDDDTLPATMPSLPVPGSGFQHFMANRPGPPASSSSFDAPFGFGSGAGAGAGVGGEQHQYQRESTASTALFRSVDSWVGQQTSRIESTEFRNQPHFSFQWQHSAGLGQVDEGQAGWRGDDEAALPLPPPPDGPVGGGRGGGGGLVAALAAKAAATGHRRQNTNHSDATVFRVHPGSEIKIPRGSLVPSEVLDANMVPSAL